jgi:hypothetical protein
MIENTAFKSFENWWDEQERKSKVSTSYFISAQKWPVPTLLIYSLYNIPLSLDDRYKYTRGREEKTVK